MNHFILINIISLFALTSVQAQDGKNEITIGVHGGWFFDDTKFEGTRINKILIPNNVSFSRYFNQQHSVMVDYSWNYLKNGKAFSQPGKLVNREFHLLQANYVYNTNQIEKLDIKLISGLSYRFSGYELIYLYSFDNGLFIEGVNESYLYNDFGVNFGAQASRLIFKNISLTAEVRYIRYLSKLSPNYLNMVFRVGVLF